MILKDFPNCLLKKSLFSRSFPEPLLLNCLRHNLSEYCVLFEKLLFQHLSSEFEVQVRNGKITPEGTLVLQSLSLNFERLQFKKNIHAIICKARKNAALHSRLFELLSILEDDMLSSLPRIIIRIQNNVFKA